MNIDLSSSFSAFIESDGGGSLSSLSHVSSNPPILQYWTVARASNTLQLEIPGRVVEPTVTPLTALFSFLPSQSEHGSSVMNEESLDLVLSEDVSV